MLAAMSLSPSDDLAILPISVSSETLIYRFIILICGCAVLKRSQCVNMFVHAVLSLWGKKVEAIIGHGIHMPCCPKRRARYLKCNKGRDLRDSKQGKGPCPIEKFLRMHLPAPLPLRKRICRKNKDSNRDTDAKEDAPKLQTLSTDASNPKNASSSVPLPSENKVQQTVHPPPQHRASLIDMVRMQQWAAVLAHPIKRRDAKYQDSDGLYPIHWASAGGPPVDVTRTLLNAYPSAIRKMDAEGSLPLHFATHYSASYPVVKLLLQTYPGAVRKQDKYGRTPLYHAADKSTGIDILKLLVQEDPSTITTPCYVPGKKIRMRQPKSVEDLAIVSRDDAIRTPLFLVWSAVILDYQASKERRGKKWDKAVWMLHTSFARFYPKQETLLSAAIAMDVFLPEPAIPLIISSGGEMLRTPNGSGQLPLAAAASMTSYAPCRFKYVIEHLLKTFPDAAGHVSSKTGRCALFEFVANDSHKWDGHEETMKLLLTAAPEALTRVDGRTGLPLAQLAAVRSRASPRAIERNEPVHVHATPATMDPYNLLADKQRNQLSQGLSLVDVEGMCGERGKSAVHSGLDTIFSVLRANPAQVTTCP